MMVSAAEREEKGEGVPRAARMLQLETDDLLSQGATKDSPSAICDSQLQPCGLEHSAASPGRSLDLPPPDDQQFVDMNSVLYDGPWIWSSH